MADESRGRYWLVAFIVAAIPGLLLLSLFAPIQIGLINIHLGGVAVVVLGIMAVLLLASGWKIYTRISGFFLERERIRADIEFRKAETARINTQSRFIPSKGNLALFDTRKGTFFAHHFPADPSPSMMNIPQAENLPEVLPKLIQADRIFIVGGMGSGKTTLAQWVLHEKSKDSYAFVIDSHALPGQWGNIEVVGMGRYFEDIERKLEEIIMEMNRRYQSDYHHGHMIPWFIMIDELTVMSMKVAGFADFMRTAMCEFRKARIQFCLCGQSKRVKALGLKDYGDLQAGFDIVVELKVEHDKRLAYIDGQPHVLPGVFHGPHNGYHSPRWEPDPEPDRDEDIPIIEYHPLSTEASTVVDFISSRGGRVERKTVLTSKRLNGVQAYDKALDELESLGHIAVSRRGKKNLWKYELKY